MANVFVEARPKGVPKGLRSKAMSWKTTPMACWPSSSGRTRRFSGLSQRDTFHMWPVSATSITRSGRTIGERYSNP